MYIIQWSVYLGLNYYAELFSKASSIVAEVDGDLILIVR